MSTDDDTQLSLEVSQESNKRLNEFLGIAAHEIKTPLTTIKGTIQIMLRRVQYDMDHPGLDQDERQHTNERSQNLLKRADIQIKRLSHPIDDVLYISRIQDKKLALQFEQEDLVNVLQEVLNQQRQINPERQIEFQQTSQMAPVLIDRDHIEQVITNYLLNALKYSKTTEAIQVTITLEEPGQQVRLSVHNNGPYIDLEDQPHIWEPFYRVQETEVLSGSEIGLGLGLYISHSIIEEHNGKVGLSSDPTNGTTFWSILDLARQH